MLQRSGLRTSMSPRACWAEIDTDARGYETKTLTGFVGHPYILFLVDAHASRRDVIESRVAVNGGRAVLLMVDHGIRLHAAILYSAWSSCCLVHHSMIGSHDTNADQQDNAL